MGPDAVVDIMRSALVLAMLIAGPLLLTALCLGVVISMLQAVTQIQEQTLSFVPKLFAMGVVGVLMLPWALRMLTEHLASILMMLPLVTS